MTNRLDVRITASADVSDDAVIGENTSVWHLAQVREGAQIGANCIIGRGAYVGTGVVLGDNCKVQNYALVYEPARLADGVFIGPAVVLGTSMVADMIIVESAMSFLGLGVQPPQASWGSMLYESRELMTHAPHLLWAPATLIVITVFGFNLLGEGLRDALDPKE